MLISKLKVAPDIILRLTIVNERFGNRQTNYQLEIRSIKQESKVSYLVFNNIDNLYTNEGEKKLLAAIREFIHE